MVQIKIFGSPTSFEVARVLTCLFEKDLEFQLIRVDTYRGLKHIRPREELTFEDGKVTLVDSRKILRHLCSKYPEHGNKKLYSNFFLDKANIEQWLLAEALNFGPPSSELVFHLAFSKPLGLEYDMAVIENIEKRLSIILDVYDRRLSENEYLAGDVFTLADLSHLPNTHYLVTMCERGKKLFTERKNVARWVKDITRRVSWRVVIELQNY